MSLMLSLWLAESAWIYLALSAIAAAAVPEVGFSPAAVLLPYGMAAATTLLLEGWTRRAGKIPPGDLGFRYRAMGALRALVVTTLHLLVGVAALVGVAWWELYPTLPPLDPAWVRTALDTARDSPTALISLVWLVVLVAALWWRGSLLAREEADFPQLMGRFLWGTLALAGLAVSTGTLLDPGLLGWTSAGFLLFELAALSIARLEEAERTRQGSVDLAWQWRAPAIAAALLLGGFGIAYLLQPLLLGMAQGLRDLLLNVLLPALQELWRWIVHLLGMDKPVEPLPATPIEGIGSPPETRENPFTLPENVREIGRRLFNLSWLALILFGFYSWIRNWYLERRRGAGAKPRRERIPWRLQFAPLAILLWLRRVLLARWPRLLGRLGWTISRERAWTMRRLYGSLLKWGARRGHARASWVTPREYCGTLATVWPALEPDFRTITESYLRTRYGGVALDEREIEAAVTGWLHIAESRVHPRLR